ncbi:hypothetical protein DFH06DRAFT_1363486 [Mycena polygramma]|nr:hypothetical protein DFH06DRAFT_1363486 [Mycena polygramma]
MTYRIREGATKFWHEPPAGTMHRVPRAPALVHVERRRRAAALTPSTAARESHIRLTFFALFWPPAGMRGLQAQCIGSPAYLRENLAAGRQVGAFELNAPDIRFSYFQCLPEVPAKRRRVLRHDVSTPRERSFNTEPLAAGRQMAPSSSMSRIFDSQTVARRQVLQGICWHQNSAPRDGRCEHHIELSYVTVFREPPISFQNRFLSVRRTPSRPPEADATREPTCLMGLQVISRFFEFPRAGKLASTASTWLVELDAARTASTLSSSSQFYCKCCKSAVAEPPASFKTRRSRCLRLFFLDDLRHARSRPLFLVLTPALNPSRRPSAPPPQTPALNTPALSPANRPSGRGDYATPTPLKRRKTAPFFAFFTPFGILTSFWWPSMSSGVITLYSTTLIRNFGFSAQRSALLNMPSGVVTLLSCLAAAYLGHESENRALVFAGFSVLAALGSALMSFLPSSHRAGLLAGIYLVNIETVTLFLNFSLTTANVAGQTKRVSTNALIAGAFALFKPRDAPQFIPAKVVLLVTQTVGALFAVGLRVYYGRQNRARDAEMESGESKEVANIEWLNYIKLAEFYGYSTYYGFGKTADEEWNKLNPRRRIASW